MSILPPHAEYERYLAWLDELSDDETPRIGEMLVHVGARTEIEIAQALDTQAEQAPGDTGQLARPLGEILVEQGSVQSSVVWFRHGAVRHPAGPGSGVRRVRHDQGGWSSAAR